MTVERPNLEAGVPSVPPHGSWYLVCVICQDKPAVYMFLGLSLCSWCKTLAVNAGHDDVGPRDSPYNQVMRIINAVNVRRDEIEKDYKRWAKREEKKRKAKESNNAEPGPAQRP